VGPFDRRSDEIDQETVNPSEGDQP